MHEIATTYYLNRVHELDKSIGLPDFSNNKFDSAEKAYEALNEMLYEYGQAPVKQPKKPVEIAVPIISEPGLYLEITSYNQPIIQPYENY